MIPSPWIMAGRLATSGREVRWQEQEAEQATDMNQRVNWMWIQPMNSQSLPQWHSSFSKAVPLLRKCQTGTKCSNI